MHTSSGAEIRRETVVREELVASVLLAFATDPFVRWLLPDPSAFLTGFGTITRIHAARTSANAGAYGRVDGRGAAFWYPPAVHPDGDALAVAFAEAGIADRVVPVWDALGAYEPDEPHWYLRQIGVDPMLQGRGDGGRLLAAGLADVDGDAAPAYLEATSARGRTFYERHGFVALGEVSVDGSPPLWPMLRRRS